MGHLGEEDLIPMLDGFSEASATVAVTFGAITVTGLYDRVALQVFDGDMPTVIPDGESVHIVAGSLTDLAPGDSITVDGVSYKVLRILPYGDGAMERLALTTP